MNEVTRHSLVGALLQSSFATMEKSASASPEQAEILNTAWPNEEDAQSMSKKAQLAQCLATGVMLEEAAIAEHQAAAQA